MSSEDRELFLDKINNLLFQYLPSFFNYTRKKGFTKTMYDLTLLHKGILLRTEKELLDIVQNSNSDKALELYNAILDNTACLKNEDNYDKQDSIANVLQQQIISLQNILMN